MAGNHHVLDWRVLAAVAGLGVISGSPSDLGFVRRDGRNQLRPTLEHYAKVRDLLTKVATDTGLSLMTVETALYRLTKGVQGKGKTWGEYGQALADSAPPAQADSDGAADDEDDMPPLAP